MYLHPFNSFLKNNFVTKRGGDSRACHSKANKQAGLVERNIYFISDASNWWPVAGWGSGVADICPKPYSLPINRG